MHTCGGCTAYPLPVANPLRAGELVTDPTNFSAALMAVINDVSTNLESAVADFSDGQGKAKDRQGKAYARALRELTGKATAKATKGGVDETKAQAAEGVVEAIEACREQRSDAAASEDEGAESEGEGHGEVAQTMLYYDDEVLEAIARGWRDSPPTLVRGVCKQCYKFAEFEFRHA